MFHRDGKVYRSLSPAAWRNWQAFRGSPIGSELLGSGVLVDTREVGEGDALILEHSRLPFISYPYEWTFEMLREAGLLTLELARRLLGAGFILKDASPFNVQFVASKPVFIDLTSIVPRDDASGWIPYTQFLDGFVYPLLVTALRGTAFQPLLRAYPDGLPIDLARAFFGWPDLHRPGVLRFVLLRHLLSSPRQRAAGPPQETGVEVPTPIVAHNLRRLSLTLRTLRKRHERSEWSHYAEECTYTPEDRRLKHAFVEEAVQAVSGVVWDLGANTGEFTRVAARYARHVIAIERDHVAADVLYRRCREDRLANVHVLVDDVANPAPALGFRLRERTPLSERSTPDLVLALALVHHLVLARNIPIELLVRWMRGLSPRWVVEVADKDDPMVRRLGIAKHGHVHPYSRSLFERALPESFRVLRRLDLTSAPRTLYFLEASREP